MDFAFVYILAMNIRDNNLVRALPLFSDDTKLFLDGSVFYNLVGYLVPPLIVGGHDEIEGADTMEIMLGRKWRD